MPFWVAARAPITFEYAVANDCNIMSWPLTHPMSEVVEYRARLDAAAEAVGRPFEGTWALMRHSAVYDNEHDRQACLTAVRNVLSLFGNLMMEQGDVVNGFPDPIPFEAMEGNWRVDPEMLEENLMFGTPDQVVEKLKAYEALGVDSFIYYASMGLGIENQRRSFELFIDRVMPEFA